MSTISLYLFSSLVTSLNTVVEENTAIEIGCEHNKVAFPKSVFTCIGEECGGEKDVSDESGHLRLEVLRRLLPPVLLDAQRLEKGHGPVHLVLDLLEVILDGLGLRDELSVLLLVRVDGLLQLGNDGSHLVGLALLGAGGVLQCLKLVAERLHSLQHVSVAQLQNIAMVIHAFLLNCDPFLSSRYKLEPKKKLLERITLHTDNSLNHNQMMLLDNDIFDCFLKHTYGCVMTPASYLSNIESFE